MEKKLMDEIRNYWFQAIYLTVANMLTSDHEIDDVDKFASNKFNFPVVYKGEEAWIEVSVSLPKEFGDEGYDKREEYKMKLEKKAEIAEKKEKKKKKSEEKGE